MLTEEQFSHLGEDNYVSVSQGKRKFGKEKYTLLWKIYNILLSGKNIPNYNYTLLIDTITNRLIDAAYSRNVPIEGWPFAQCHHSWSNIQKYAYV